MSTAKYEGSCESYVAKAGESFQVFYYSEWEFTSIPLINHTSQ